MKWGELYYPAHTLLLQELFLSSIIYYSSLTWPSLGTFLGGPGISNVVPGLAQGILLGAVRGNSIFQTDPRGFTPRTEVPPWSRLSSPYKWNQQVLRVEQLQSHVGSGM
jgi:hypothetical protein